jgi:hypothetical protein
VARETVLRGKAWQSVSWLVLGEAAREATGQERRMIRSEDEGKSSSGAGPPRAFPRREPGAGRCPEAAPRRAREWKWPLRSVAHPWCSSPTRAFLGPQTLPHTKDGSRFREKVTQILDALPEAA